MILSPSEYWSQSDPKRNVKVKLSESDFILGASFKYCDALYTQVYLRNLPEKYKYLESAEYVVYNKKGNLWTTDPDGNPKKRSVFFIP